MGTDGITFEDGSEYFMDIPPKLLEPLNPTDSFTPTKSVHDSGYTITHDEAADFDFNDIDDDVLSDMLEHLDTSQSLSFTTKDYSDLSEKEILAELEFAMKLSGMEYQSVSELERYGAVKLMQRGVSIDHILNTWKKNNAYTAAAIAAATNPQYSLSALAPLVVPVNPSAVSSVVISGSLGAWSHGGAVGSVNVQGQGGMMPYGNVTPPFVVSPADKKPHILDVTRIRADGTLDIFTRESWNMLHDKIKRHLNVGGTTKSLHNCEEMRYINSGTVIDNNGSVQDGGTPITTIIIPEINYESIMYKEIDHQIFTPDKLLSLAEVDDKLVQLNEDGIDAFLETLRSCDVRFPDRNTSHDKANYSRYHIYQTFDGNIFFDYITMMNYLKVAGIPNTVVEDNNKHDNTYYCVWEYIKIAHNLQQQMVGTTDIKMSYLGWQVASLHGREFYYPPHVSNLINEIADGYHEGEAFLPITELFVCCEPFSHLVSSWYYVNPDYKYNEDDPVTFKDLIQINVDKFTDDETDKLLSNLTAITNDIVYAGINVPWFVRTKPWTNKVKQP